MKKYRPPTLPVTGWIAGILALRALFSTVAAASADAATLPEGAPPEAAVPATPDTLCEQGVFEVSEFAPGVYVADVLPRPTAYAFANSLVVDGDDGVLVVDTQQSPAAARALIDCIRQLTDRPVRWVVNTHGHADHLAGNAAYRAAYPDAEFIAHRSITSDVMGEIEAWRRTQMAELPASVEERRQWLRNGRGPTGEALTADDSASLRYSLRLREAYLEELRTLELVGPTTTFDRRLELDLGGRSVRLLHFGRAHTASDVIVQLPDDGLLAVGDLLEPGIPWTEDADVVGWASVLDSLAALETSAYLPGHGPLQRGGRLLRDYRELFHALVDGTAGAPRALELSTRFQERYGVDPERFEAAVRTASRRPPAARAHHQLVYHGGEERAYLIGGSTPHGDGYHYFDDVWARDADGWVRSAPLPFPRSSHAVVYDAGRDRLVLFGGGFARAVRAEGVLWERGDDGWRVLGGHLDAGRNEPGMCYDRRRDRIVVFGGWDASSTYRGDTWEWTGGVLERVDSPPTSEDDSERPTGSLTSRPVPRAGHAFLYDPVREACLLFGGRGEDGWLADTWAWDGTSWKKLDVDGPSPSARWFFGAATDLVEERIVLFGGTGPGGDLSDTWAWDGAAWSRLDATGPPARSMAKLAFHGDGVLLFGGRQELPEGHRDLNDAWILRHGDWMRGDQD